MQYVQCTHDTIHAINKCFLVYFLLLHRKKNYRKIESFTLFGISLGFFLTFIFNNDKSTSHKKNLI